MAARQPKARPRGIRGERGDGLGFILLAYARAGVPLARGERPRDPAGLYRVVSRYGHARGPIQPKPGDLAFFHHTRDRNRNGRLDDRFTMVALVTSVDRDGTVRMLREHRGRIVPVVANPRLPHRRYGARGKVLNSYLRPPAKGERPGTPHLAGECLAGFVTIIR